MKNTKPVPQEQIFSIVLGFWQARALAVATEVGLPDLLAEGPLHVDELAPRTKTNVSALFRLLRALESAKHFGIGCALYIPIGALCCGLVVVALLKETTLRRVRHRA